MKLLQVAVSQRRGVRKRLKHIVESCIFDFQAHALRRVGAAVDKNRLVKHLTQAAERILQGHALPLDCGSALDAVWAAAFGRSCRR